MKVLICESQFDDLIDYYISAIFKNLEEEKIKGYPKSIFYSSKSGDVKMELTKYNVLKIKKEIRDEIMNVFGLTKSDVIFHLQLWIKTHWDMIVKINVEAMNFQR